METNSKMNMCIYAKPICNVNPLKISNHLAQVQSLTSFELIAQWDTTAHNLLQICHAHSLELKKLYNLMIVSRSKMSLWQKIVTFIKSQLWFYYINKQISIFERFIITLQQQIDYTPNSRVEVKEMLAKLKLQKKELLLEKTKINQSLRDIRNGASSKLAKIGPGVTDLFVRGLGKYRQHDRMNVRRSREEALAPYKARKNQIENKINFIEVQVIWLNKLK